MRCCKKVGEQLYQKHCFCNSIHLHPEVVKIFKALALAYGFSLGTGAQLKEGNRNVCESYGLKRQYCTVRGEWQLVYIAAQPSEDCWLYFLWGLVWPSLLSLQQEATEKVQYTKQYIAMLQYDMFHEEYGEGIFGSVIHNSDAFHGYNYKTIRWCWKMSVKGISHWKPESMSLWEV